MRKVIRKDTFYGLLIIFIVCAIGKIYQYGLSDPRGFGIMNYILNAIESNTLMNNNSFDFPIKIYSLFKFMGFHTHLQWSIFYTIIFSIIFFCLLLKFSKYNLLEYIYIYFSMFVLSWTVFNMNKDLIQLMILLIVYGLFQLKISNNKKILGTSFIFLLESLVFRSYYILSAGLVLIIYYFLSKALKKNSVKPLKLLISIFILFFIGVYCCKYISYDSFDELINRRESLTFTTGVTTIIKNVFQGNSTIFFIPNYLINFLRICIPLELVKFGPKYCIFFIYQIFNSYILYKSIKHINKNNILFVTLVLAYIIMLVASESDFGTLARHQSVLLMFYIELIKDGDKENEKKN